MRILLLFTNLSGILVDSGFVAELGNAELSVDCRSVFAPFLERNVVVEQHGGFYGLCEAEGDRSD